MASLTARYLREALIEATTASISSPDARRATAAGYRGGSWLAISLRTGYWNPWFLACVLTVTASFAVLYSVSVLFGVLTRNGTVAALASIGLWFLSSTVVSLRHVLERQGMLEESPRMAAALDVAYTVLPKTTDIGSLNTLFLSKSHLSEAAYERFMAPMIPDVDWTFSLGTTALFTLVVLALAAWRFHRTDY